MANEILTPALVEHLQDQFRLDWQGIHGAAHWARVRVNGLQLAEHTGADTRIVELFAFLHDSQRENDHSDRGHGPRAAEIAAKLNGRYFHLDADELELLVFACEQHTFGGRDAHPTVQTFWDADRLELGRVGNRPDPARSCTEAAAGLIEEAYARSLRGRPW